jgi:hypothetical protein
MFRALQSVHIGGLYAAGFFTDEMLEIFIQTILSLVNGKSTREDMYYYKMKDEDQVG